MGAGPAPRKREQQAAKRQQQAARIKQALAGVPIPEPWDRARFVRSVAELRGRPITLIPVGLLGLSESPCGLWLVREHDDVIIHEDKTSDFHIDQIVCHEIGHMLLGHDRAEGSGTDALEQLFRTVLPDLDPAKVRAVLGRSDYESEMERDAELFASMIMVSAVRAERDQNFRNVLFRPQ